MNELPINSEEISDVKSTTTPGYFVFQKLKEGKRKKTKEVFISLEEKEIPHPTNDHIIVGRRRCPCLTSLKFIEIRNMALLT